jgi:prenyltransferase beta subunit
MLQVARLAPRILGESTELVRRFLATQLRGDGAGQNRDGGSDLYYTIFVLGGLQALQAEFDRDAVENHLRTAGTDDQLDFVHLGALARCWGTLGIERGGRQLIDEIITRIERYRSADGGYDGEIGSVHGNAYGCFIALGAYQDLQRTLPFSERLLDCLKTLETSDGAWANASGMKIGSTNATAAAITILRQLNAPAPRAAAEWLAARQHVSGGFLAMPSAPLPDLLSTATTLHALAQLEYDLPVDARERCLDFVDSLWSADGGFHGHWADDPLDAEYTFYGLLALGHLAAMQ